MRIIDFTVVSEQDRNVPARPISAFATTLVNSASDPAEALKVLQQELCELERAVELYLFRYEERRGVLCGGSLPEGTEVAFDLLPRIARKAVADSKELTDLKDASADFIKLLSLKPRTEGGSLILRGMSFDVDLCWVLAVYVPKKLFGGGSSVAERINPYIQLFELALARHAEHQARAEAALALETITSRTHAEYSRALELLKGELERLRAALKANGTADPERVTQLEIAAARASADVRAKTERLAAVEAQVASAVTHLERAHLELHKQSEILREQGGTLNRIRELVGSEQVSGDGIDLRHTIRELLNGQS